MGEHLPSEIAADLKRIETELCKSLEIIEDSINVLTMRFSRARDEHEGDIGIILLTTGFFTTLIVLFFLIGQWEGRMIILLLFIVFGSVCIPCTIIVAISARSSVTIIIDSSKAALVINRAPINRHSTFLLENVTEFTVMAARAKYHLLYYNINAIIKEGENYLKSFNITYTSERKKMVADLLVARLNDRLNRFRQHSQEKPYPSVSGA